MEQSIAMQKSIARTNLRSKIAFTTICVGAYILSVCGVSVPEGLAYHFTYFAFHANIFHLALNLLVLWSVKRNKIESVKAYLICVAASWMPMYVDGQTLGLSGFLFAMFGLMWGKVNKPMLAIKTAAPIIIVTMLLPNVNGLLHLYSYVMGYLLSCLTSVLYRHYRA